MKMDIAAISANVIVVEDDRDTAEEIAEYLSSHQLGVDVVDSGSECLNILIGNQDIDVIVSDLYLPDISGIDIFRAVRSEFPFMPWLQFIMITGHAEVDVAVDSLRLGATDFLQKPVDGAALVHAVTRAVIRASQIRRGPSATAPHAATLALPTDDLPSQAKNGDLPAEWIERLVKVWGRRRIYVPPEFISDPAWDMLLDLFLARQHRRDVSVTSLCIASGAPTTTALRRIDALIGSGLIRRVPDKTDGRRTLVCLTDKAETMLTEYFALFRHVMRDR